MTTLSSPLRIAVDAARAAGDLFRREFHRAGGPRGADGHTQVDQDAEQLIRQRLLAETDWGYRGEETGTGGNPESETTWIVDPNDGTAPYLQGWRGSAVSIAAVRGGIPILGVVYAYSYPDDEGDLIAWAEDTGPVTRNGVAVDIDLSRVRFAAGQTILVSHRADQNSAAYARCVAPGRFRALPGIAYRLALVGTGEAVAAISLHPPQDWDYAGAHAIVRGAGGVLVDESGAPVTYTERGESHCENCFGGGPAVIKELLGRPWKDALARPNEARQTVFDLRQPAGRHVRDAAALARAQGCLLGQLAGDSLGSLVEFRNAADIRREYPDGVTELVDGGRWGTLAGQPTDDSELALLLARSVIDRGGFEAAAAARAYGYWYRSDPFDMGNTTARSLSAAAAAVEEGADPAEAARRAASRTSQANGSLMRVSPLGVLGAGQAERAAEWARADSSITHPHPVCQDACAAFVAAIATAVGSGAGPADCLAAALRVVPPESPVREALERASAGEQPDNPHDKQGWVLIALQNAFFQLLHASSLRDGVVATVMRGYDTDTNAAIAGALLGAVHGRAAVPADWRRAVLSCRPVAEARAAHCRPVELWPVDALEIAEELLALSANA